MAVHAKQGTITLLTNHFRMHPSPHTLEKPLWHHTTRKTPAQRCVQMRQHGTAACGCGAMLLLWLPHKQPQLAYRHRRSVLPRKQPGTPPTTGSLLRGMLRPLTTHNRLSQAPKPGPHQHLACSVGEQSQAALDAAGVWPLSWCCRNEGPSRWRPQLLLPAISQRPTGSHGAPPPPVLE